MLRRRSRKRQVACLCRPHYDMIAKMHNDSCAPMRYSYCVQPVQNCCITQHTNQTVPVSHPCAPVPKPQLCAPAPIPQPCAIAPIPQPCASAALTTWGPPLQTNLVGQSEGVYWSNILPQTMPTNFQPSTQDQTRKQGTIEVQKKEYLEPKVESLEDKAEVRRYQEPIRERVKQVETSNYLAPRPEPQFCPEQTWLLVSTNKTTNKRLEEPRIRHNEATDAPSQDRFFEYYMPPRDDYARRMEKLSNASLERRFNKDDYEYGMESQANPSLEKRMRAKGLTKSEISLLEDVPYSNRRRGSPANKHKHIYQDRINDNNLTVQICNAGSIDNVRV